MPVRSLLVAFLLSQGLVAQELPPRLVGIVKKIDFDQGTLEVEVTRKGVTESQTLNLFKRDIDVTDDQNLKVDRRLIAPGQTVTLSIRDTGDVDAIMVRPTVFQATITRVDPEVRKIAVQSARDKMLEIAVAPKAPVTIAGRSAFLREVKVNSVMELTLALDNRSVTALRLVSDPDGKLANKLYPRIRGSRIPGNRVEGTLTAVDADRREVQFASSKSKGGTLTLALADKVVIEVLYDQMPLRKITLAEVRSARGILWTSKTTGKVERIFLEAPVVRTEIKRFDGEAGEMAVAMEGQVKTYPLAGDFRVMNGNRVLRWADLNAGARVTLVLSLDRKKLLGADLARN